MGEFDVSEVDWEQRLATVAWVHEALAADQRCLRLEEASLRFATATIPRRAFIPLEARRAAQRCAAAYMLPLPGRVMTLGGVRCTPNDRPAAVELLRHCIQRANDVGTMQTQAIVEVDDLNTANILECTYFVRLTSVAHLCLALDGATDAHRPAGLGTSAVEFAAAGEYEADLAQLIVETFDQTLDCPKLNGIRTAADVLTGFMDGKTLADLPNWYVILIHQQLAGCLLMMEHPRGIMELAYLGIVPSHRGRNLGSILMSKAIEISRAANAQYLVAAADKDNWPVLSIYQRFGFGEVKSLDVWLFES
ncbi:MAG: GNAT family N-acetyltransferase [Planctomycetales bacterium]|nr:GNAT family N-acetyltransferase [Planctomycetales bacterium]